LIDRAKRRIVIRNWNALATAGGFNPAYLHLNQAQPAAL